MAQGEFSHDLTGCAFPLVYNIHRSLHAGALCVGADQGTDLLGNAALTADDPAHILRGHTQLQRQLIAGFYLLSLLHISEPTRP